MAPILEARRLGRRFGALQAVNDVDMAVEPGELRAIIGPNGAGKTTFFHLLSGVVRPTSGQVRFRGEDISALSAPARCRRGLSRTFQITSVFPELTALENVRMAIQARRGGNLRLFGGGALVAATERQAHDALAFLGIDRLAGAAASTLSHGDQRLLEMTMALAQGPDVLLLDEPTQGLSPEETASTVEVVRRIWRERGLTVLLVEHDMDVVFGLAERITVLNFGAVIADGPPDEIRTDAEVQRAYLGGAE
jgi:branched-chain amino acid transport system ATP-binding protein